MPITSIECEYSFKASIDLSFYSYRYNKNNFFKIEVKDNCHSSDFDTIDDFATSLRRAAHRLSLVADDVVFSTTKCKFNVNGQDYSFVINDQQSFMHFVRQYIFHHNMPFIEAGLNQDTITDNSLTCNLTDKVVAINGVVHVKASCKSNNFSENHEFCYDFNENKMTLDEDELFFYKLMIYLECRLVEARYDSISFEDKTVQIDLEKRLSGGDRRSVIFHIKDKSSFYDFAQTFLGFLPKSLDKPDLPFMAFPKYPIISKTQKDPDSLQKPLLAQYKLLAASSVPEEESKDIQGCWQALRHCLGM